MAHIFRMIPNKGFTKIPNDILFMDLSTYALSLYMVMSAVNPKKSYNDEYYAKVLGVSIRSLANYKKELKEKGLLYVKRINNTKYINYLGNGKITGKEYKELLDKDKGEI